MILYMRSCNLKLLSLWGTASYLIWSEMNGDAQKLVFSRPYYTIYACYIFYEFIFIFFTLQGQLRCPWIGRRCFVLFFLTFYSSNAKHTTFLTLLVVNLFIFIFTRVFKANSFYYMCNSIMDNTVRIGVGGKRTIAVRKMGWTRRTRKYEN